MANFKPIPTMMKAKAVRTVRVWEVSDRRSEISAIFNVPVTMNKKPIPIRINVAPMVPMTKYWKDDVKARLSLPIAMRTYDDSDDISRKTNTLNASPVIVTPSNPVRHNNQLV